MLIFCNLHPVRIPYPRVVVCFDHILVVVGVRLLLGQVVQRLGKLDGLADVAQVAEVKLVVQPGPVVSGTQVVLFVEKGGLEEGVNEAVEQVDGVHDGLGALEDLTVEGALDVVLNGKEKRRL